MTSDPCAGGPGRFVWSGADANVKAERATDFLKQFQHRPYALPHVKCDYDRPNGELTMDTPLTHASRIELARSLRRHCQAASSRSKKQILEEFIAVSGYHPKYVVHLLIAALTAVPARQLRMRPTIYDAAAKQALVVVWEPL